MERKIHFFRDVVIGCWIRKCTLHLFGVYFFPFTTLSVTSSRDVVVDVLRFSTLCNFDMGSLLTGITFGKCIWVIPHGFFLFLLLLAFLFPSNLHLVLFSCSPFNFYLCYCWDFCRTCEHIVLVHYRDIGEVSFLNLIGDKMDLRTYMNACTS